MLKLYVTPEAKDAVDAMLRRWPISQQEIASRVFSWFAESDESTQAAILDLYPRGHRQDIAATILASIVAEPRGDYRPPQEQSQ